MKSEEFNIAGEIGQRLSAILHFGRRETVSPAAGHNSALVIMAHSLPGSDKHCHNNLFQDLEYELGKDGVDTMRFDFRGCGESSGNPETASLKSACDDLALTLDWAQRRGYKRCFLLGEGLGAAIALVVASRAENPERMGGLIMLWPSLDPAQTALSALFPALEDQQAQQEGYITGPDEMRIGLELIKQLKLFSPVPYLEKLAMPLLVQHGDADEKAPVAQLELLSAHAKKLKRIELTTYEGGDHGLTKPNERKTMFYHIRQFVQRYN